MSSLSNFPADWRTDVQVQPSGRNDDGDPVTGDPVTVHDCLVGPRATTDPVDRSDVSQQQVTLYGPPRMPVGSTDQVTVPDGHFMAGTYEVDGQPSFWPLGTEVALRGV